MRTFIEKLGLEFLYLLESIGRAGMFLGTTVTNILRPPYTPYPVIRQVYFIGARDNKWTLEALNWETGESTFHYVIGGQRYNSQYSCPITDEFGGVMFGTTWGRARIAPKPAGTEK